MATTIRVVTANDLGDDFDYGNVQGAKLNVARASKNKPGLVRFATNGEAVGGAAGVAVDAAQLVEAVSGISGFAQEKVRVSGSGLAKGGGDLTSDRVITVTAASSTDTLEGTRDDVAVTPLGLAPILSGLTNGSVPSTRKVLGTGLATGGGDLFADRVIDVPASTEADAIAGIRGDVAVTPASLRAALDFLYTRILGAPPSTLDTLQEIADALGNDPNLATTLTDLIGTKSVEAVAAISVGDGYVVTGNAPNITIESTLGLGTRPVLT